MSKLRLESTGSRMLAPACSLVLPQCCEGIEKKHLLWFMDSNVSKVREARNGGGAVVCFHVKVHGETSHSQRHPVSKGLLHARLV